MNIAQVIGFHKLPGESTLQDGKLEIQRSCVENSKQNSPNSQFDSQGHTTKRLGGFPYYHHINMRIQSPQNMFSNKKRSNHKSIEFQSVCYLKVEVNKFST